MIRKCHFQDMKITKGIDFTVAQMVFLKREAKRLGISIAEYIRRIIDEKRGA